MPRYQTSSCHLALNGEHAQLQLRQIEGSDAITVSITSCTLDSNASCCTLTAFSIFFEVLVFLRLLLEVPA